MFRAIALTLRARLRFASGNGGRRQEQLLLQHHHHRRARTGLRKGDVASHCRSSGRSCMKNIANETVRVIVEKIHPRDPQLRAKSLIALEQQDTAPLQFAVHAADAVAWGYREKFAASFNRY